MYRSSDLASDARESVAPRPPDRRSAAAVLIPNPHAVAALEAMRGDLEERLFRPIRRAGCDVPSPVLTAPPAPLEVRRTNRGTTVVAADFALDPLIRQDRGRLRAPKKERRKLKRINKCGLDPDRVLVVREIPGHWVPGQVPPRMIGVETVETARTRHLQHLQVGAAAFAFGRAMLYVAGTAFAIATTGVVALGAITIAGAIGAAGSGSAVSAPLAGGLDPLILAGIEHPRTGAVAWVPIAAWDEIADHRGW